MSYQQKVMSIIDQIYSLNYKSVINDIVGLIELVLTDYPQKEIEINQLTLDLFDKIKDENYPRVIDILLNLLKEVVGENIE